MTKNVLACILGTFFMTLCSVAIQGQVASTPYEKLKLPSGERFPVSEASLVRLRDNPSKQNLAKMRAHAWDLFAGLTGSQPIWQTWYSKCDVRLESCNEQGQQNNPGVHREVLSFEVPVQLINQLSAISTFTDRQVTPNFDSDSLRSALTTLAINFRKHPQFASVLYNREAANHIKTNCIYDRAANAKTNLPRKCPPMPTAPGKIVPFKRGAIILKTSWERVTPDDHSIGELWTWKPALWNRIQKANASQPEVNSFQVSNVRINLASKADCEDRDYDDAEVVPLKCFYTFRLTQEDVTALGAFPPHLTAISDNGVIVGDYLVLVAVHVTTKEIPDWVWATFWWDNHGTTDSRAAGRPSNIMPQWRHFLMDTTLSGTTPLEEDRGPKICFNPYLETSIPNGPISNCLQCHGKAAYGPKSTVQPYDLGILGRDGTALASGSALLPNYMDNRVQTDFIWSLSEAQDPNVRALVNLFGMRLHDLHLEDLRLKGLTTAPPLEPN
ncbi:hypothetical protein [Tunturiibacter gelidoferens]|uniref:Uncharacterized protein n=1 Tax=Tunturiibacter gelidiferens TaxID=3069689 RepID=A0ACC5NTR1_9BACT|nr:hypothetical protein [Edaphobacter lichenicola]MBB5337836.1 hypothetical protein [Edaphobacter lichenicola]